MNHRTQNPLNWMPSLLALAVFRCASRRGSVHKSQPGSGQRVHQTKICALSRHPQSRFHVQFNSGHRPGNKSLSPCLHHTVDQCKSRKKWMRVRRCVILAGVWGSSRIYNKPTQRRNFQARSLSTSLLISNTALLRIAIGNSAQCHSAFPPANG